MININLISPNQRANLEKRRNYFVGEKLFIFIFLLIFILSSSLAFAKYLLTDHYDNLISEGSDQKFHSFSKDVTEINNQLKIIEDIQNDYFPLAEKLDFFVKIVPPNIFVTNLKMEKRESFWLITIYGKAKTRQDLLNFHTNLKETKNFSEIEFPISNLLKKENIDFQFTVKLTDHPS